MTKKKKRYWLSSTQGVNSYVTAWKNQGVADGGVSPSASELTALSDFIDALELVGLGPSGSRMKTGNILHLGSKELVKLNIKDVSTFKWTESGTVTFSAGNGCRSASNSYFNQPFKTDQYAGIENNSTFIQYISESSTAFSATKVSHGFRTHATSSFFVAETPLATGTLGTAYHYNNGINYSATNHKGLRILSRAAGTLVEYFEGVKTTSGTAATAPNISINRLVLAYNSATVSNNVTAASFYPHYVAIDFIYDAFNDTDAANFKTAFDTYKTAVGLP